MLAIIENLWDINYVQRLPVQIQQKVLRTILEKDLIYRSSRPDLFLRKGIPKYETNLQQNTHAESSKHLFLRTPLGDCFEFTKEITQCETWNSLKTDIFKLPDKKNTGKLFSK